MNRSEGNIFTKNNNSIEGVFEFMFIYTGKIEGVLGQEQPLIKKNSFCRTRKIKERLLSQGC